MNRYSIALGKNPEIKTPKKILSEYIGMDIDVLLKGELAAVFGGSLRDIIAKQTQYINDVDIVCINPSCDKIMAKLMSIGYTLSDEIKINTINSYDAHHILEPKTLVNKERHKVQLIRPVIGQWDKKRKFNIGDVFNFIRTVDLSCCGMAYTPEHGLKDIIGGDAMRYCSLRLFWLIETNKLYNFEGTIKRKKKLIDRGWTMVDPLTKVLLATEGKEIETDDFNSLNELLNTLTTDD